MGNLVRTTAVLCVLALVAGCASHRTKPPSYDDTALRPINQDLVSWMKRLNIEPPGPASNGQGREEDASVARVPVRPSTGVPIGKDRPKLSVRDGQPRGTVTAVTQKGASTTVALASPKPVTPPSPAAAASTVTATASDSAATDAPWQAKAGTTLRAVLERWTAPAAAGGQSSGWRPVVWATRLHYDGPVLTTDVAATSFLQGMRDVVRNSSRDGEPYPVVITFYKRQNLIVVSDRK